MQKNLREFSIKKQGKTLTLRAESDEECAAWVDSIRQCIAELDGVEEQFSDDEEDNGDVIDDEICKGLCRCVYGGKCQILALILSSPKVMVCVV